MHKEHIAFSQIIYKFLAPDLIFRDLKGYIDNVNWDKAENRKHANTLKQGKSYKDKNLSLKNVKELNKLHFWLDDCLNYVKEEIGWDIEFMRSLSVTQSWLNYSKKGETHHLHNHSLSLLSGILYITEPSVTHFFCPSIYTLPRIISSKKDSFKTIQEHYSGKKGELIIFPSSLNHCVGPNLSKKARITFSFNSWFNGAIGNPNALAYIPEEF